MPRYNECGIYEKACRDGVCNHPRPNKPKQALFSVTLHFNDGSKQDFPTNEFTDAQAAIFVKMMLVDSPRIASISIDRIN